MPKITIFVQPVGKTRKINKCVNQGKEEIKLSLFTDYNYIENVK